MKEKLDTLAEELGHILSALGARFATAESCTGGWIAKVATDVVGASDWFDRGFITYSNQAKREMLGVAEATLLDHGAVSAEVVAEMAAGALRNSQAQVAVAVSGIAGPGGASEEKPVGTVFLAWALWDQQPVVQRLQFAGDRAEIRHQATRVALERLIELLQDHG